jgi:DNA-binding beta-propeller fold protein YncE
MYSFDKNTAEIMWKSVKTCPTIEQDNVIEVQLPSTLIEAIHAHGKVEGVDATLAGLPHQTIHKTDLFPLSFGVGVVTTVAGSFWGFANGKGINVKFDGPYGVCLNPDNNCLYICDHFNNSIRKMTLDGEVTSFVPNNGKLSQPTAIVMDHNEKCFYVANCGNHTISKISQHGETSIFAGNMKEGYLDGAGTRASFNNPAGLAFDPVTGHIFVSDSENDVIRKINMKGVVTTLAGSHSFGFRDGVGKNAWFNCPWGICFDANDHSLLVCDFYNDALRKVTLDGIYYCSKSFTRTKQPNF